MAEACRALDLPVVGGNVSLYNESGGADIDPDSGARGARAGRGGARAAAGPVVGRGDTVVLLGAGAPARTARSHWRRRAGPPSVGTTAAAERCPPSTSTRTARSCSLRGRPGGGPVGSGGRGQADAASAPRSVPCTTSPGAAWPSPWPRWRPRRVRAARSPSTTRPNSSPSCRRVSWWPRADPDDAVRPGRGGRGRHRRAGSGRGATGSCSAPRRPSARDAVPTPTRGRCPGRWGRPDGCRDMTAVREWEPR